MPNWIKFLYSAFAVWCGLFLLVFSVGTNEVVFVFRGFWPLLTLLTAPVFVILASIALFKKGRKIHPVIILLLSVAALATFRNMQDWGARINFHLHRNYYESLVKGVLAAKDDEARKLICGGKCTVYHEDVTSLSFLYSRGFLNWSQIVYDPIGIPRPQKPGNLHPNPPYDTYLVKTRPLAKDWYFCHFID